MTSPKLRPKSLPLQTEIKVLNSSLRIYRAALRQTNWEHHYAWREFNRKVLDLRVELRHAQIAYNLLRGRSLSEFQTSPSRRVSACKPIDWASVLRYLKAHCRKLPLVAHNFTGTQPNFLRALSPAALELRNGDLTQLHTDFATYWGSLPVSPVDSYQYITPPRFTKWLVDSVLPAPEHGSSDAQP